MIEINIAKDFAKAPGARNYDDGKKSGEEFFKEELRPKYILSKERNVKLKIIIDGTEGFPSSFINEAFGLLGNEFPPDEVWDKLVIISVEVPKYIKKLKESIYERRQ